MLRTAGNVLSDNLENVVVSWPDFGFDVEPFYYELADAIVDVDRLRQALSQVMWASRQIEDLRDEYTTKIRNSDVDTARKHRKQAFARMADVMDQIEDDLRYIGDSRDQLKVLPDIRPDEPAIVIAGYPNVGKSSFVNRVTRASNQIAEYPFTTKGVQIGHFERDHVRYQIVDTPACSTGRKTSATTSSGRRSAPSNTSRTLSCSCSTPRRLRLPPLMSSSNSARRSASCSARPSRSSRWRTNTTASRRVQAESVDATMSVTEDENVEDVLDMAVEAAAFEPDLPTRDGEGERPFISGRWSLINGERRGSTEAPHSPKSHQLSAVSGLFGGVDDVDADPHAHVAGLDAGGGARTVALGHHGGVGHPIRRHARVGGGNAVGAGQLQPAGVREDGGVASAFAIAFSMAVSRDLALAFLAEPELDPLDLVGAGVDRHVDDLADRASTSSSAIA